MAITGFQASEAISADDAVYVTSLGFIARALGTGLSTAAAAGVAIDSGAAGALLRVNVDSIAAGFTGLTPGKFQYVSLSTPGSVVDYTTWETQFSALAASGAYLTIVGKAVSTTELVVEVGRPLYVIK
jgi:hypothetical protein